MKQSRIAHLYLVTLVVLCGSTAAGLWWEWVAGGHGRSGGLTLLFGVAFCFWGTWGVVALQAEQWGLRGWVRFMAAGVVVLFGAYGLTYAAAVAVGGTQGTGFLFECAACVGALRVLARPAGRWTET